MLTALIVTVASVLFYCLGYLRGWSRGEESGFQSGLRNYDRLKESGEI
jgi:hypothetical protein